VAKPRKKPDDSTRPTAQGEDSDTPN
jgi:hypothetical protein